MKYLVTAIVFAVAAPAAAQTAPAQQHQGHGPNQQHGQGHAQHQPGQHQSGEHQPGEHREHRDCCADRNGNGRMDCCEERQAAPAGDDGR